MNPRPRILVATAKPGFAVLERLFENEAGVVYAFTLWEAIHHLDEGSFDLVLCTIHFDDSRMFDLVRYARAHSPSLPCVCTRVLDTTLKGAVLNAMTIAVESLGAVFIDRFALLEHYGDEAGNEEFRKRVLAQIRTPPRLGSV